ncbi:MAG: MBL fold metallo-hydrolase, partial [Armatimonadota bacterium]
TTTLITGEGFRLLVDPSGEDADRMASELDRRSGLRASDVDAVFFTHEHGDHHAGLRHFPNAQWWAAPAVAAAVNRSHSYTREVTAAGQLIFDAIQVMHTPGHTATHHSLRFDCGGMSVVIAGDAVMTRDFWDARLGYFNSADFELAARTIDDIAAVADIVVPGHDNYLIVSRAAGQQSRAGR